MQEHSFRIEKTNRFYTAGNLADASKILIVLHGYGQSAFFFLKKFEYLVSKGYFIVAPEGMHRFYLEGTSGRVGASWMTREARLDDIQDNFNYLENLLNYYTTSKATLSIHLLGFSQGAATATRWFEKSKFTFNSLVLWASVFPDDVSMEIKNNKQTIFYFVLGDNDPYFTKENAQKCIAIYESLEFKILRFEGKHEINHGVVTKLFG